MLRSLPCLALLVASAAAQGSPMSLPPRGGTFQDPSKAFGFYFQAPIPFLITGLRVPDDLMDGTQNVAAFIMEQEPPSSFPVFTSGLVYFRANEPSAQILPTAIPVFPGDWVGVLGACGTSTMKSSRTGSTLYPLGPLHSGFVLGTQVALKSLTTNANLSTSGGNVTYGQGGHAIIGRVEVWVAPLPGVSARFEADETEVGAGATVAFTDQTFTQDPGGVTSWQWDLDGDGTVDSTVQHPTFTYPGCGTYDVTLTVTDAAGSNTVTKTAYIRATRAPVADFSAAPDPVTGLTHFTDTSAYSPSSWAWDFDGDGTIDSTAQHPTATLPRDAAVPVTLTVWNACGTHTSTETVDTRMRVSTRYDGGLTTPLYGMLYFDMTVLHPGGIQLRELEVNTTAPAGAVTRILVLTRPGSYVGHDTDLVGWTYIADDTGISAGRGNPTLIDVPNVPFVPGTHAIAVAYWEGGGAAYTYGDLWYGPLSNTYIANSDLALQCGVAHDEPFDGAPRPNAIWNGAIYYAPCGGGSVTQLGGGCPNSTGSVAGISTLNGARPTLGQTITLQVDNAPPSQSLSAFLVGFAPFGGLDLGFIGMPGCDLWVDARIVAPAGTDASGRMALPIPISESTSTIGLVFWAQGLLLDPSPPLPVTIPAVLSDALTGTVGGC